MRTALTAWLLIFGAVACSASSVLLPAPDAGYDPIPDSGPLTSPDAGPDAGFDAGFDAGLDGGLDGGKEPRSDAGDAGPEFTFFDGGFLKGDGGLVTKYPLVLAHGFGVGPGTAAANFFNVLGALQDAGASVYADDADAFNSTTVCGGELLTTIEEVIATTGAPAVNVLAHSMGGLDARYVASPGGLGRGDLIASITMLSTPNQGSEMADFTLSATAAGNIDPAISAVELAFGILNPNDPNVIACLTDLSTANATVFNAATPNDPSVMYQSWAGVATVGAAQDPNIATACGGEFLLGPSMVAPVEALLIPIALIVSGTSDDVNDGVVPVTSSRYGTFRGCVPADHLGMSAGTLSGPLVDPDPSTGYDAVGFYLDIVRDLAARGY